jgi:hypothetical protein
MIVNIYRVISDNNKKLDELTKYLENIPICIELDGGEDIQNLYCIDAKFDFTKIAKNIYNEFIINNEYTFDADDHKYNNNYRLSIDYLSLYNPYRLIKNDKF